MLVNPKDFGELLSIAPPLNISIVDVNKSPKTLEKLVSISANIISTKKTSSVNPPKTILFKALKIPTVNMSIKEINMVLL